MMVDLIQGLNFKARTLINSIAFLNGLNNLLDSKAVLFLTKYEFLFLCFVFVLYFFQSIYGFFFYGFNELTILGFILPTYTMLSFYLIYNYIDKIIKIKKIERFTIEMNVSVLYGIIFSYFLILLTLCVTAPSVPLFVSIKGGSMKAIYASRLNYDLTREGWEKILTYAYIFYNSSLCPFVVVTLFDIKNKFRWLFLLSFSFALLLCLAKASFIFAFFPIIYYYLNSKNKNIIYFFKNVFLFFMYISISTFFFFGIPHKIYNGISEIKITNKISKNQQNILKLIYAVNKKNPISHNTNNLYKNVALAHFLKIKNTIKIHKNITCNSSVDHDLNSLDLYSSKNPRNVRSNFLLDRYNPFLFMINRFFWIPYATMHAYLGYRANIMKNENVSIVNTIRPLSKILGAEYIPYDSYVFNYQYRDQYKIHKKDFKQTKKFHGITAAPYFVEIYAKYGLIPFLIVSLLIPFVFYLISSYSYDSVRSLFSILFILICTNPFITVITSGLIFIVFLIFVRINFYSKKE